MIVACFNITYVYLVNVTSKYQQEAIEIFSNDNGTNIVADKSEC